MVTVLFAFIAMVKPVYIIDARLPAIRGCYLERRVPSMNGSYHVKFSTGDGYVRMFSGEGTKEMGIGFTGEVTHNGIKEETAILFFVDMEEARVLHATYLQRLLKQKRLVKSEVREYWSDGSKEQHRDWFAKRFKEVLKIAERSCAS